MSEQEAVRRLVKSPPELWEQCSDPLALAKHLSTFGEIMITRLEPENTVAWEGESARGTVEIEASGWGTRVRLTATAVAPEAVQAGVDGTEPAEDVTSASAIAEEPVHPGVQEAPATPAPRSLGARLSAFFRRRGGDSGGPVASAASVHEPAKLPVDPDPEPVTATVTEPADLVAELEAALDSLGQAHHRPYSRT